MIVFAVVQNLFEYGIGRGAGDDRFFAERKEVVASGKGRLILLYSLSSISKGRVFLIGRIKF